MEFKKHIDKLGLVGLISIVALLSFSLMTAGHYWGGDFSLYIAEAKSLIEGNLYSLIEKNTYSMQQIDWLIGPYAYPLGYPILLAPVVAIFGLNFIVLKLYTLLFLLLSIPCAYYLFKKHFQNSIYAFILALLLSLKLEMISFSNNVLSDFPSLFFLLFSFWAMPKSKHLSTHIGLGVLFFFSYIIRDLGLFLLPAFFIFQVQAYFAKELPKLNRLAHFAPYLTFVGLFLLNKLLLPSMGENHTAILFQGLTIENITWGLSDYSSMLFNTVYEFPMGTYWVPLASLLFIVGILSSTKKTAHFLVFALCYFALLVVWPKRQGLRFVFQLYPFALFFILKGIEYIFLLFQNKWKPSKYIGIGLISILGCYNIYNFVLNYKQYQINYTNQCYTPELQTFYECVKEKTKEDDIITFFKPRVLRLFTDRNSVWVGTETGFIHSKWQYWITHENKPIIENHQCLCTAGNFRLFKKRLPTTFSLKKELYHNDFENTATTSSAFSNKGFFVLEKGKEFSPGLQGSMAELGIQSNDLLKMSIWLQKPSLDQDPKKLGNLVFGINRDGKSIIWQGFLLKETSVHNSNSSATTNWIEFHAACYIPEILPTDVLSVYAWKPEGKPLWLDYFDISLWQEDKQKTNDSCSFDRVIHTNNFNNQALNLTTQVNYSPPLTASLQELKIEPNDYIRFTATVYRTQASTQRTENSNLIISLQASDKKNIFWKNKPIEPQLDTLGSTLKAEWKTIEHWAKIPANAQKDQILSAYVWRPETVKDGDLYLRDLQIEVWKK